jgi:hypothetical protein
MNKEEYERITKRFVIVEWLSLFAVWIVFIIGLITLFVLHGEGRLNALMLEIALIFFFAILPFLVDFGFYLRIWKAMAQGCEIVFKAETKSSIFNSSILGAKEVWIKKKSR